MLTVRLVTVLTIAVMSMSPEVVESARTGVASHHTSMDMEEKELITSVGILMGSHMLGAIQ